MDTQSQSAPFSSAATAFFSSARTAQHMNCFFAVFLGQPIGLRALISFLVYGFAIRYSCLFIVCNALRQYMTLTHPQETISPKSSPCAPGSQIYKVLAGTLATGTLSWDSVGDQSRILAYRLLPCINMITDVLPCIWLRWRYLWQWWWRWWCLTLGDDNNVVQGHPRSMILVPIESAYTTSY